MDNRLTLGVVHIVEWLRSGDIKTGRDLFDELEPLGIASRLEVPVTFSRAATRALAGQSTVDPLAFQIGTNSNFKGLNTEDTGDYRVVQ